MTQAGLLEEGLALHRAGRYDDAACIYGSLLRHDPSNVAVLRLLGMVHTQCGRFEQALMLLQAASRFAPEAPEIYNDLGIALRGMGACEEAIQAFSVALNLKPSFGEAMFNKGVTVEMCGRPDEAYEVYTLALRANPLLYEARFNRAVLMFKARRFGEAAQELADVRRERGCFPDAHLLYGKACHELGRREEAKEAFAAYLSLVPGSAEGYMRLGLTLLSESRFEDALTALQRAHACGSEIPEVEYVLGLVHLKRYEWREAREALARAQQMSPNRPEVSTALGIIARQQGRLDEARRCLETALSLNPDHADAHWYFADLLLLQEDYDEGWGEFEWRWKHNGFLTPAIDYAEPVWNGEDIRGQTILLYPEQGYGDILQFVRYAPMVAALGADVYVGSPPELSGILETVPGIAGVVTTRGAAPPFDVLCPLLSLPRLFKTRRETIPSAVPYLRADPRLVEKWAVRFPSDERLRVGIIWSGNPLQEHNRHRSCRLGDMAPLFATPDVLVYSLQKGTPREELAGDPQASGIIDLADALTDFSQTAAVLHHLDVLVSTDTGPVHLAGALGRPVFLLLSTIPDWRWGASGDRTPWYPSFRLFRQEQFGVWDPLVHTACSALNTMTRVRRAHDTLT